MIIVWFIIFFLFLFFLAEMFYEVVVHGNAPFFLSKKKVIKEIVDGLGLKEDAVVYELGCGSAYFLREVRKKYKNAKLIGIEFSFLPYLTAFFLNIITGSKIETIRKNFLDIDLRQADFIYCFLLVEPMQALGEKFKRECRPGTQIASYQFSIHEFRPVRTKKTKKLFGTDNVYYYII